MTIRDPTGLRGSAGFTFHGLPAWKPSMVDISGGGSRPVSQGVFSPAQLLIPRRIAITPTRRLQAHSSTSMADHTTTGNTQALQEWALVHCTLPSIDRSYSLRMAFFINVIYRSMILCKRTAQKVIRPLLLPARA